MPWAVRNEGRVSQDAKTDWESLTVVFREEVRGVPGTLSIFWAVILGVSDVGVLAGTYIVIGGRCTVGDRRLGPLGFVVHAATDCNMMTSTTIVFVMDRVLC